MASRPLILINAALLGPEGVFASSLRIERGRITAIDRPPQKNDLVFDLGGSLILPGLINSHDHLELNHFGKVKYREQHTNAAEWIEDTWPRLETDPYLVQCLSYPLADRLVIGGIKNLLAGVTTVCHHNPLYRQLKWGFPVRVVRRYGWTHSFYISGEEVLNSCQRTPAGWPWIIHLAEGTDRQAALELARLDTPGALKSNTVLVHGVGLNEADRDRLVEVGAGLVWCPASNLFLLGQTAEVRSLAQAGLVALGSDSRLTGERDLLDELKVAAETGQVSPARLFRMVTTDAARLLRLNGAGRLAVGGPADLVVLPPPVGDPFESLVGLRRDAVRLVMVGGQPRLGDLALRRIFKGLKVRQVRVKVDGAEKVLAGWISDRLRKAHIREEGLEILL